MTIIEVENIYSIFRKSTGISIDTRTIYKGNLFFCLKGDTFNANKFAEEAIQKGAIAAIVDESEYAVNENIIVVENVLTCLQNLANFHRRQLTIPIIAITGSNGKTTTKELITAVLRAGLKTHATSGNYNNHIGVPLTLLSIPNDSEIAIVEMGANHQKEIEALCKIAEPDWGLITNIGKAHLEGFGGYQGVIKAKNEMYEFLKKNGKGAFVNADDELLMDLSQYLFRITYGSGEMSNIKAYQLNTNRFLSFEYEGKNYKTQLLGSYNFYNALAALAIGTYFKIDKKKMLKAITSYKPENKRSQLLKTDKNQIYLDAYNANPSSMKNALDSFINAKFRNKVIILGDMLELGQESVVEHQNIIDFLIEKKQKNVILIGHEFMNTKQLSQFKYFIDTKTAESYFINNPLTGKSVLLKGSRGIALESLLKFL